MSSSRSGAPPETDASAADAPLAPHLPAPGSGTGYRWRWVTLAVVLLGEVMDLLDSLVTNIAGPSIRADLGGGASTIQWLGAAYTLAMAVGLITGGRLGDLYGRRRMFLIGAAGFTLSSALCAVAGSPEILIGGRVLQGLLGAVMLPQGLGILREVFPPTEVAAAFGAFGPVMGLSAVGGPVLAGWLIGADYFGTGWRMIFLINLPLGVLAVAGGLRFLPESRPDHAARLDLPGVGLAGLGSVLVVLPLVQGRELGWPAWTFVSIAASVVVFALFGWLEVRTQRRGGDPLVVPGLFRKRAFSGSLLAGLGFFTGLSGLSLALALYLQIGLGYSPFKAGLAGIPMAVGLVIAFVVTGSGLSRRLGRTLLQAGLVAVVLGVGALLLTLRWAGTGVGPWQLAPALLVTGLGMGMVMSPFFTIALAGVEPHENGSASGTLTAVQQLGGALGVAVLGTVFFGSMAGGVGPGVDAVSPDLRARLTAAGVPDTGQDQLVATLRRCGHDRAEATDPAAVPASCRQLETLARTLATGEQAGRQIGAALADAGTRSARLAFDDAIRTALLVEIGLLAVTFVVAFSMPRQGRPESEPGH